MKYQKIGRGKVLKCFMERMTLLYGITTDEGLICPCGHIIGVGKQDYYQMKQGHFVYSGQKENT